MTTDGMSGILLMSIPIPCQIDSAKRGTGLHISTWIFTVQISLGTCSYIAIHMYSEHRPAWAHVRFTVSIEGSSSFYKCECGMAEHMGLLCCHILKVMMHLDVAKIPTAHILGGGQKMQGM